MKITKQYEYCTQRCRGNVLIKCKMRVYDSRLVIMVNETQVFAGVLLLIVDPGKILN